ncbi:MAG: cation-transporting P-type ATPase [Sulfuricaulis sp.]|nr:cation-transporting P-type ATPase [Sulfuricaulis sp.]
MKDVSQTAAFARRAEIVAQRLAVDPEYGLDDNEIVERRNRHGSNQLRAHARQSVFVILAHQFKSVIVWLLALAAGLSFYFHDIAEGVAIVVVLAINAMIGSVTELRAARSMEALLNIATVTTRVRRGGKAVRIDAHDLVPGDIVLLDMGDMVTADLRLIQASNLQCDESVLTGESVPVAKQTDPVSPDAAIGDRACMVFTIAAGAWSTLDRTRALVHCCGSGRFATARRWGRGMSPLQAIRWNWRCCASQGRPERGTKRCCPNTKRSTNTPLTRTPR